MKHPPFIALALTALPLAVGAQEFLDRVDDALYVQSKDGACRVDLSGTLDIEGYYIDQRPPGLIFYDHSFVNPRLSLFLDGKFGKHFYAFLQSRIDRGFDPGDEDFDARLDEYLLRYTPLNDARVNVQVGKFATVVGNWVRRHDSWSNPFITAPLPYENVTIVADKNITPDAPTFLARRDTPDKKDLWVPLIWGPVYASGASLFGAIEKFDYAVEMKNAAVSSRPEVWSGTDRGWENPTVSARLGYRPAAAWNLGTSFSYGSYLQAGAEEVAGFPAGKSVADFKQTLVGADLSYAWRHLEIWSEFFASRFEVPNVGDANSVAYYVEAKYKITTQLFGAVRWNQQFFGNVPDGSGGETSWDRNAWRVDVALGYRLTRHLQGKLQYSFNHQNSTLQQGEQLVAVQATLKF